MDFVHPQYQHGPTLGHDWGPHSFSEKGVNPASRTCRGDRTNGPLTPLIRSSGLICNKSQTFVYRNGPDPKVTKVRNKTQGVSDWLVGKTFNFILWMDQIPWVWVKNCTTGFRHCVHLPGCHFGYLFFHPQPLTRYVVCSSHPCLVRNGLFSQQTPSKTQTTLAVLVFLFLAHTGEQHGGSASGKN